MNSPEVYQENHLFEGPNGQLFRSLTYSNGAEHLYRVDEITGKQAPISKNALLTLHEAEQAVEEHTEGTPIIPYTAYFTPTTDPTSIALSVIEPAGSLVRVDIPSLEHKIAAKTSTERPPEPDVMPQAVNGTGVIEPSALTLLSLAVVVKGGKSGFRSLWARAQSSYDGYFKTNDPERNDKRKGRAKIIAGALAAIVLLGVAYCAESDKDEKSGRPVPTISSTPGPSTEKPGASEGTDKPDIDDNGSGKDSQGENKTDPEIFVVQEGNGITHELIELAAEQNVTLSAPEAFQQYLKLEASAKSGTPFFIGKNSGTYIMSDGHYGISNAGIHQWHQDMLKQAQKWLDDNKDELSD